jgi:predicted translin family RNA/ssDNA-binding protein
VRAYESLLRELVRSPKMYSDEVIAEVWRNRDEYVRQHHNNLDEIVEDLRRRQAEHPERIVERRSPPPTDQKRPSP